MTLLPEIDAKPDASGLARFGFELLAIDAKVFGFVGAEYG